ncbi:LOW QUALITY PROTEIN: interferon-induced very large GTPase 1-like [Pseudophryne corroboree]|uniref:LOW QUALITY PROTEIN: interferon-induced very large GTPase 1-like n=1 Tax=Pseudophryne corroboree TaxID=495146 RepID=UPI0030813578
MDSIRKALTTIKELRGKLMEVCVENVEDLCDHLKYSKLILYREYKDVYEAVTPAERAEKLISIILQKGEPAWEMFLHHLEKMTPRFPALSDVSQQISQSGEPGKMTDSIREALKTIIHLRWKLGEVYEENVDGLCDELDSLHLITPQEYTDLYEAVTPAERIEKLINLILQKREPACEMFLHHLENMVLKFPALDDMSQNLPENYEPQKKMVPIREASWTIKQLRWKLMEVFEENVDGLCDELDSLHLITLQDYIDQYEAVSPAERAEKLINIILQKGAPACETFLHHLENMVPRFPALTDVSQHLPENKVKTFKEFLENVNIHHPAVSKLTLRDVLEIGSENLQEAQPQDMTDIPWNFLRKLMALNRTAINTRLDKLPPKLVPNDRNMFDLSVCETEDDSSSYIHPLDVVCAVLHCSESFLQQEIVSKMSMCQFAIPLLLPAGRGPECTFMLWAMRDIVKRWRPQSLADSKGFREDNVVNIPMPIFSFVKLGKTKLSKSKILNKVLNPPQQHHNFFIYEDMEGGNSERKISDGLVEISWYFPSGKSDVFPEPVAVTNLRGDLASSWEQFTFLTQVSSAVFVFIENISDREYRLLSSCSNTDTEYYLILTPSPGTKVTTETVNHINSLMSPLNITKTNIIVKSSTANYAAFVKQIQNTIESLLIHCQKRSLASAKDEIQGDYICVDENAAACQTANDYARNITSVIRDVEKYKKETLKLQGDLWKQLSKIEKELCRMTKQGGKNAQEYSSELIQQRHSLHKEQNQHDISEGISLFINAITHLSQAEKHYFLKWMKFELDSVARNNISTLQSEYMEKCNNKSHNVEQLKQLDQKISDSSLGVEHFLRELGQVYEAECAMVNEKVNGNIENQFTKLPGIAANLLLDGFPLELIDGDAANIPLRWITDVLTELDTKTGGHCRMRVITVLGVQSTGKSTLLNTMFGLQFPVASGRCTRGAFMTLIKVRETFQEELGCDFILVIDTEGLKAPELASLEDSYEHDNELATLVVGLSDITIVNMAMENTVEMKDILQIVVHAFLRMKEIGKKPNCQFVHQNVSDVSAHQKNMRDRKKLLEQLNEMTKVAAKMEKKIGMTAFSDVMDYDLERHNWYIPGLWQGVPPMAPVNFGYSENVYELKKYLFKFFKSDRSDHKQCQIPEFITWIESLWNAVKHEKFIFSFRNSLVAEAYNKLAAQYSQWEWEFTKTVHSWVMSTETSIRNQSADKLDTETCAHYRNILQQLLQDEETKMLELVEKYFDNRSDSVHLIERYREDFFMSVRFLRKELERNALNKVNEAVSIRKGKFKIQNIQNISQKLIEGNITELLRSCRERNCDLGDMEVKREFEAMWEKTLSYREEQIEELPKHNVDQAMLHLLRKEMSGKGAGINQKLSKVMSLDEYREREFQMHKKYIDSNWFSKVRSMFSHSSEPFDKVTDLAASLLDACDTYITEKVTSHEDYNDTYCQELLHMINAKLEEGNNNNKLHFSPQFEVDIKLLIFGRASDTFQKMHDTFIQENDPKICLEKLKPQYFSTFESIFHEKDECRNRAKKFCELCLRPALTEYILRHLGKEIMDEILHSPDSTTFINRSKFQRVLLEELLEENSFQNYIKYINSYERFLRDWVFRYIAAKYQSPSALNHLQVKCLHVITEKIQDILKIEDCLNIANISDFLEQFCELLTEELVISQNEMQVVTFCNTADVGQFCEDILSYLPTIEEHILSELGSLDIDNVLSRVTLRPQDELCKKVIGCGHQCPFCKVPCENVGGDHTQHSASVHRPKGLGKYRWSRDETLVTDICSTAVVSNVRFRNSDTDGKWHPYKEYRAYYPDWVIQPDATINSSDYWKYIFVQFNKKFAETYDAKPAVLPNDWKRTTREQALQSLEAAFTIK